MLFLSAIFISIITFITSYSHIRLQSKCIWFDYLKLLMLCLCMGHRSDKLYLICSLYCIEGVSFNIHTICYSDERILFGSIFGAFGPVMRHVGKVNASIEPLFDEFQTISWFVLCEYHFTIHLIQYGEQLK